MAKIYVATSWRNLEQPGVVALLRSHGHEVYDFRHPPSGLGFQWTALDPKWQTWTAAEYRCALKLPAAQRGFNSDFDGMRWADIGVLLLPCGRSAHLEVGWMAGAGKKTIVWTRDGQEPELMNLLCSEICVSAGEVLVACGKVEQMTDDEARKICPGTSKWRDLNDADAAHVVRVHQVAAPAPRSVPEPNPAPEED